MLLFTGMCARYERGRFGASLRISLMRSCCCGVASVGLSQDLDVPRAASVGPWCSDKHRVAFSHMYCYCCAATLSGDSKHLDCVLRVGRCVAVVV